MLINNDFIKLETNNQGLIAKIFFNEKPVLNNFQVNLKINKNQKNLWEKIVWEWIRDQSTLTLLATEIKNLIDIQYFIKLKNNQIQIEWWITNFGDKKLEIDLKIISVLMNIPKVQTKINIDNDSKNYLNKNIIDYEKKFVLSGANMWKSTWNIEFKTLK